MTVTRVDAGRGWSWIVEGWRLFAQAPGIWIVVLLIYLIISVVLSLIPLVGLLGYALLNPLLIGGMLYGAAAQARGEPLEIAHLFRGFQDQDRVGPLIMLGLISVAGYVLIFLVVVIFVGGSVAAGIALNSAGMAVSADMASGMLVGAGLLVMLIALTIGLLVIMALFYGIPLVMLEGQNAWPAAQDSIVACWANLLPLLVFGLIYLVLSAVAMMPLGLGFLILLPVTICAVYASYQDVFGATPARVNLAK
jgi:uncharacterized membrane protein